MDDHTQQTGKPRGEATFLDAQDDTRDELVGYLERDQLEVEMDKTLPPARLGHWSRVGLWALRVFVLVVGAMVIYTFIAGLH